MTIYIVDIEPLENRYTGEWFTHVPKLLESVAQAVVTISGPISPISDAAQNGSFLNFADTNSYKASQVWQLADLFQKGAVKNGDKFLFTDAWHPGVVNLRYMADLLGVKIEIHGLWHAGSYDVNDFLGRLPDTDWAAASEQAFLACYTHNWVATQYHKELLCQARGFRDKVHLTGWPMEYLKSTLQSELPKRDLVVFPHRKAPEKQLEVFLDLKKALPEFEFVVCQDSVLTKPEYHQLLAKAKVVFSASLQETLGIGCYEGMLLGATPMVPDRLSYSEMYPGYYRYPSAWTATPEGYESNKDKLVARLRSVVAANTEEQRIKVTNDALKSVSRFFSADNLIKAMS